MRHAWAQRALIPLIAVGFAGLLAPAQASALASNFNCVNKPSHQWCDGRANGSFDGLHSWSYADAWNPGGSSIIVCQGLYRPSTGNFLFGSTCGWDIAAYDYPAQSCGCLEANAQQQSGGPRSINGYADTW